MLVADDGCALTLVCFQDKTELASLIPAVDGSVGTTTIAETIFVKTGAVEFGLRVLLSKCSIFEKLFGSVGWVPELKRSSSNSHKSQVIWLLGPLDIANGICSSRNTDNGFLLVDVENAHVVIV